MVKAYGNFHVPVPSNLFEVMKSPELKKLRQKAVQSEKRFKLRMMKEGESDQQSGEEMVDGVIKERGWDGANRRDLT